MNLLDFARGPALEFALTVFVLGVLWRITAIALLSFRRRYSEPRSGVALSLLRGVSVDATRSWPHREFIGRTGYGEALGYSYHIGLFIVILAFAPHIAFFKSLLGVSWPALPSSWIHLLAVLTLTLLIAVLFRRITHRVLRRLSNFDDYFSWLVTALVVVTGILATGHIGARYEDLLAWHILSVDLLLVWFPFGKLMHAFFIMPSRALNGYRLARKGAAS